MDVHLDSPAQKVAGNHRHGHGRKTVLIDEGAVGPSVPRDQQGPFDPQWIETYRRRLVGFDETIITPYARRHDDTGYSASRRSTVGYRGIGKPGFRR